MKKVAASLLSIVIVLTGCNLNEPIPGSSIKVETNAGLGSGVKISENFVLTAAHVVQEQKVIKIKTQDNKIVVGRVLVIDGEKDLAVVQVNINAEISRIRCQTVEPGVEFSLLGNPLGIEFIHSWGRIASKAQKAGTWESVYITDSTLSFWAVCFNLSTITNPLQIGVVRFSITSNEGCFISSVNNAPCVDKIIFLQSNVIGKLFLRKPAFF